MRNPVEATPHGVCRHQMRSCVNEREYEADAKRFYRRRGMCGRECDERVKLVVYRVGIDDFVDEKRSEVSNEDDAALFVYTFVATTAALNTNANLFADAIDHAYSDTIVI